jgi:hypothetical protein
MKMRVAPVLSERLVCIRDILCQLGEVDARWVLGIYSHIFQKLFHLRIILRFNLLLIQKLFLPTLMLGILEPMAIKCVFLLIPRDIVDNDLQGGGGALVGVWLTVGLVLA